MIHVQLKSIVRSLLRNKNFTLINIFGLAVGFAVFILIFEYLSFEWGANRFHKNYKQLYRAAINNKQSGPGYYFPPGIVPVVKQNFPEVAATVRIADGIGGGVVSYNKPGSGEAKALREENMLWVDGNFLEVFTYPLVSGSASLAEPSTMAISTSFAKKMFGRTDVAGTSVIVSTQFGNTPYSIRGVYTDMPENSDIRSDILLSLNTLANPALRDGNDWADPNGMGSGFVNAYLLLKQNTDADKLAGKISTFFHEADPGTRDDQLYLQPMQALHLAPSFNYPWQTFGSIKLVAMLLGVAILILLIALVNYINLNTVQALKRAKETGIRKVLGASRLQLTIQYLAETFLITLISVAIALVLVGFFQKLFNDFTGKQMSITQLNDGWSWLVVGTVILCSSLLAGAYVAFVVSAAKPSVTLRGKELSFFKGFSVRKGFVVFQFCISILFIIATIVMYRQLHFMQGNRQGIKLDQLMVIKGPTVSSDSQAEKNYAFKNALAGLPFIQKYAASNNVPGQGYNFSTGGITRINRNPADAKNNYKMFICDNNYFDTYGITFTQGKAFTGEEANSGWSNSKKVVINEKAAALLGFKPGEQIAGQKIVWEQEYEIAGVIKDYNHLSMRQPIDPMIILPSVSFGFFTVQMNTANLQDKISALNKLYKAYFPGNPYEYFFADETFNKQYFAEQQLSKVFIASSLLAILIACLGLFGLAAYAARQRVKEIGIRKVLGASVGSISTLVSKDFIQLVLVSIVIATPLAWWTMHKWLQDFAYRTHLSWWIFLLSGSIAILIALITVSFHAIKAAVANPVKSLRTE